VKAGIHLSFHSVNGLELPEKMLPADHTPEMVSKWIEFVLERERFSFNGAFSQGLIHNINSPLQNISMLVELMKAGFAGMDDLSCPHCEKEVEKTSQLVERQRQWLQKLDQQVSSLDNMLRELRVLNEIERNPTEVDLNLVVSSLVKAFQCDLFFKHHVQLELRLASNLPLIRVLARHLMPALVHLFQNAMIALRGVSERRLFIESRKGADRILLSIMDSGCGLNPGEESRCFDLFYSGWSPAIQHQERHFGVGLFLASSLLEPYGIEVELKRERQKTVASLKIPI
jgi:signal transduction histidine kinase